MDTDIKFENTITGATSHSYIVRYYGTQDTMIKTSGFDKLSNSLFFKKEKDMHENFSMNVVKNEINIEISPFKTSFTVPRKGDILDSTFIKIKLKALPNGYYYKNLLTYNILDNIILGIGG